MYRKTMIMMLTSSVLLFVPLWAVPEKETAWEALVKEWPAQLEGLSRVEREALKLMDIGEAYRLLDGAPVAEVSLLTGESLASFLERKGQASFDLSWYSIDAGAARLAGEGFVLTGTIGQTEAGLLTGGEFVMRGGFTVVSEAEVSGAIFTDGFESGDVTKWSNSTGTGN